jgi:aspartyl-tRNA(Asn)/glutamyl-tRNA(Gln) amidotransferase subunit B
MEIITEPDIKSSRDAAAFVHQLLAVLRALGTCDGQLAGLNASQVIVISRNSTEGSLRVDANVSLRPVGSQVLGTRTEIKNINGLKHLQHAIGRPSCLS